jgi:hypothetical protein
MLEPMVGEQLDEQAEPLKRATLDDPGATPPDQFAAVLQSALAPAPVQIYGLVLNVSV